MRDFDAERAERENRERTFRLGGHEFRFRPALEARTYSTYLELMDRMAGGAWPEGSFDVLNATVLALLEPEYHERWSELVAVPAEGPRVANPVTFDEIVSVIEFCVESQTVRPTSRSSVSGSSGDNGSTRSTGVSGSPAATSSPGSTFGVS